MASLASRLREGIKERYTDIAEKARQRRQMRRTIRREERIEKQKEDYLLKSQIQKAQREGERRELIRQARKRGIVRAKWGGGRIGGIMATVLGDPDEATRVTRRQRDPFFDLLGEQTDGRSSGRQTDAFDNMFGEPSSKRTSTRRRRRRKK